MKTKNSLHVQFSHAPSEPDHGRTNYDPWTPTKCQVCNRLNCDCPRIKLSPAAIAFAIFAVAVAAWTWITILGANR